MPTYRQVWLDREAEKVLAPTDWAMSFEEMAGILSAKTGYAPRTIERAMYAVADWDMQTPGIDAVANLRKNYNLEL